MTFGAFDFRFSARKPKRGIAKVRIKSVTIPYGKRPMGTAIDAVGQEYPSKFRENGMFVEAIMKMADKGINTIRFERVA